MGKSRKARKLARRQAAAKEPLVTGNMLERIRAIRAADAKASVADNDGYSNWGWKQESGHAIYNPAYDIRTKDEWVTDDKGGSMGGTRYYPGQGGQNGHGGSTAGYNGQFAQMHSNDDEVFTCPSTEIEGKCPIASVPNILIPASVWQTWINLASEVKTEWIAFFHAEPDEQGDLVLQTFYFPPQTATSTSVDVPDGYQPKVGTNGAVHSHVAMGAFWSVTDKQHSNWPTEIVVNCRGDYEALQRHQLKCGGWSKSKADVKLLGSKVSEAVSVSLANAFKNGERLAKGKRARPDDSPEPAAANPEGHTLQQHQPTLPLLPAVPAASGTTTLAKLGCNACSSARPGYVWTGAEDGPWRPCSLCNKEASQAAQIADSSEQVEGTITPCGDCEGAGMVDIAAGTEYAGNSSNIDFCSRCNGWGRLLDGQPISAMVPDEVTN